MFSKIYFVIKICFGIAGGRALGNEAAVDIKLVIIVGAYTYGGALKRRKLHLFAIEYMPVAKVRRMRGGKRIGGIVAVVNISAISVELDVVYVDRP
jgi:hypothetical protein